MSLEERVAALEKGFVAIQQDLLAYRTDPTSTNTLGILNKVIGTQELRYREIEENETMLLGMATSMQKDIKTLKEDVSTLKEDVSSLKGSVTSLDGKLEQVLQLLTNRP